MTNKNSEKTAELYEKLVGKFAKWAETCSDISAVIIVGSRARSDHPADEWADLDIMIVTSNPERYLSRTDWLENIGNPLLTFVEPTANGGEMERRVLFEGMLDVDFAIIPERKAQQLRHDRISSQIADNIANTFGRGIRILLDKNGIANQIRTLINSIGAQKVTFPTQNEFHEVINDFLYHAVFTVKHLRRGEIWGAGMCCNCYMQRLLLRMIEWHAQATLGQNHDTWFRGRFLEEWADSRVLEGLRCAFAQYGKEEIKPALLATMHLFRSTATETAEKLGYQYPFTLDSHVTEWVGRIFSEREV